MMANVDVCVVGGGPAGLAAAAIIATRGLTVRVVGCEPGRATNCNLGETLSSSVLGSLRRLGVGSKFHQLGLPEIAGFQTTWGSSATVWRDQSMSQQGEGWILDRRAFERMLGAHAKNCGADLQPARMAAVTEHLGVSRIWIDGSQSSFEARFIIYATGRHGIRATPRHRIVADRLVACVTKVQVADATWDRVVRIDALEDGWIYSIQTSPEVRVLILFTDGDLLRATTRASRLQKVAAGAAGAPSVSRVLSPRVLRTIQGGDVFWAATQFRVAAWGERWMACGDAVQSYDPLASRGIAAAVEDGIEAADTLLACIEGRDNTALLQRDWARRDRFVEYLRDRYIYYRSEPRWISAPFWKRRQSEHFLRRIPAVSQEWMPLDLA